MDPAGVGDRPAVSVRVGPEQPLGRRAAGLDDVQQLEGDEPGRVRRMARDPDAAIGRRDRFRPGRGMVAEVGRRVRAAGRRRGTSPAARRDRRRRRRRSPRSRGVPASRPGPAGGRARPGARRDPRAGSGRRTARPGRAPPGSSGIVRSTAEMKPSQAGKPPRASSIAGARTWSRDSRPKRAWASPQERTAPGTVTLSGPRRGIVARPRARRAAASAAAGARPEPLSASCRRVAASQMSQNASPPIPQALGRTTPRTAFVAIAASTAWPPARRIERPAAVARWCGATTAPWRPRASGTGTKAPGPPSLMRPPLPGPTARPARGDAPSFAVARGARAPPAAAPRSRAGARPCRPGRPRRRR